MNEKVYIVCNSLSEKIEKVFKAEIRAMKYCEDKNKENRINNKYCFFTYDEYELE
jgi:hypothetical protein